MPPALQFWFAFCVLFEPEFCWLMLCLQLSAAFSTSIERASQSATTAVIDSTSAAAAVAATSACERFEKSLRSNGAPLTALESCDDSPHRCRLSASSGAPDL